MYECDFLFVYEVKNRELENICLLKVELERRGYSVEIRETWRKIHYEYPRVKAKVVVTFALYDNAQISFNGLYARDINKLVNMQWEQLRTISDENNNNSLYSIKENAKHAVHISWGQFNRDRLVTECGINEENVCMAGHMTMDFLKPRFKEYYLTKKEIYDEYNINPSMKLLLFVSSFSYVDMSDEDLQSPLYKKLSYSALEFKRISVLSQKYVLEWIECALNEIHDTVFIYRPHPAEVGNIRLTQLEEKYENFKVIRDYSIKQWIVISDHIYTWYSTSIAEIYAANKSCGILRPVDIPEEYEIRIYKECESITKKEDFINDILNRQSGRETSFPLNIKLLKHYYELGNEYSYIKICDKLEEVYKDKKYSFDFFGNESSYTWVFNVLRFVKHWMTAICRRSIAYLFMNKARLIGDYFLKQDSKISKYIEKCIYVEKMIQNNYASSKEIDFICNKIKRILEC